MGRYAMVVNVKDDPYDIYGGRTDDPFHYGNPFSHLTYSKAKVKVSSRKQAVEFFDLWLKGEMYQDLEPERRQWILDTLPQHKGKVWGCHCAPKLCHCTYLARRANTNLDSKEVSTDKI